MSKPGLDQLADAAAQHRLLAEQVGFGLLGEGGLDDARAGAADALGIGQRQLLGLAGGVLVYRQQARGAAALGVDFAHAVARRLGRDHRHIDILGRLDGAETDIEPVGKHEHLAGRQVRGDIVAIDLGLGGVRSEQHDHIRPLRRRGDIGHRKTGVGHLLARLAGWQQPYADLDATVFQVQGMSVPLRSVTDNRHFFLQDETQVSILVIVHFAAFPSPSFQF